MTAFQDAASSLDTMQALHALDTAGELRAWVVSSAVLNDPLFGFAPVGGELIAVSRDLGGAHHRPSFVKIFLDGIPPMRTAALLAPYLPDDRHGAKFRGRPGLVSIVLGIVVGALIGLANGLLVTYLGAGAIVTTLGTATLIQAFVSFYSKNETIVGGIPTLFIDLGAGDIAGVPRTVCYLVVVGAALYYALQQTPFGRHLYYIGENRQAIELLGIPVKRYICSSFVVSGTIAAAAGVLQVAIAGSASPQVGPGFTLPGLAAAFLGATAIRPGRFNVIGTLVPSSWSLSSSMG